MPRTSPRCHTGEDLLTDGLILPDGDVLLSQDEAANRIGMRPKSLAVQRCQHPDSVPPHVRLGHVIAYRQSDVERFIKERAAKRKARANTCKRVESSQAVESAPA